MRGPIRFAAILIVGVLLPGLMGCGGSSGPSPSASAYLTRALDLLRRNSMDVNPATWPKVVAHAKALARNARTPAGTYDAIRYAVASLEDAHTRFLTPAAASELAGPAAPEYDPPSGRLVAGRYAYIKVGAFSGTSSAIERYVRGGIRTFGALNRASPCGWIVDLRNNSGGNVWPMLTVVAPLLHGDPVGYFVKKNGGRLAWHVRDGQLFVGDSAMIPETNRQRLTRPSTAIAVLTDYNTGSAGEAAVLAFQGQPNVKTFGLATMGAATANQSFTLSDGALLLITGALDADRTGHTYRNGEPIYPDTSAADPSGNSRADPAQTAALRWLTDQPPCR